MLTVEARDGAGRLATAALAERTLPVPNLLWIDEELGPEETDWEPLLSRTANPKSLIVNPGSLWAARPATGPGQLLLERRLEPAPAMAPGQVRLRELGPHVAVLAGAVNLARNPKRLAPALVEARRAAGYSRLLYSPGLGEPSDLAVLAYAGVDLFDAAPLSLAAARGLYLTTHGGYPAEGLSHAECACPACHGEAPRAFTEPELRRHNQYAARAELGVVRNAMLHGRLRELVEARVRSHPELTALLRRLDAQYEFFDERVPVTRRQTLFANTKESLRRPEVLRFRRRIRDRYAPRTSAPILLLLPCSHRKPYARSRTHRAIADAVAAAGAAPLVHEVIVTSPLGLVPRELELTYPAAHYDVPVTGEWDEEEGALIRELLGALLAKHRYPRVVSHLPRHTDELVRTLLPPGAVSTCQGEDATKPAELERLTAHFGSLAAEFTAPRAANAVWERLYGLATYQFGPETSATLFEETRARGRWPAAKLMADATQLAMLPPERGLLSLTLPGAQRLASSGTYVVEIDDFPVRGSVFAVGVNAADPQIRVGDEVAVVHDGQVRGAGVAFMSGPEMAECERGEAVKVRHHA